MPSKPAPRQIPEKSWTPILSAIAVFVILSAIVITVSVKFHGRAGNEPDPAATATSSASATPGESASPGPSEEPSEEASPSPGAGSDDAEGKDDGKDDKKDDGKDDKKDEDD